STPGRRRRRDRRGGSTPPPAPPRPRPPPPGRRTRSRNRPHPGRAGRPGRRRRRRREGAAKGDSSLLSSRGLSRWSAEGGDPVAQQLGTGVARLLRVELGGREGSVLDGRDER